MSYPPLARLSRMLLGASLLVAVSPPLAAAAVPPPPATTPVLAADVGQTEEPTHVRVQMTAPSSAAHGFYQQEEAFVQDVYARLMRYDLAARKLHRDEDGAPATPDDYLTVALQEFRTRRLGDGALPSLKRPRGPIIRLQRGERCQKDDPCYVFYDVNWSQESDVLETFAPTGPVVLVTTFRVTLTLAKRTLTYSALVLFHDAGDGLSVEPELLDPFVPDLQRLIAEDSPAAVAPWALYARTTRYAAVKQRLHGRPAGGADVKGSPSPGGVVSSIARRLLRPIGYLVGDDIAEGDIQMAVMSSGVSCGSGGECTGQPDLIPCSDDGNPSCDVDQCQGQICHHDLIAPLGACPGVYGWDTSGLTPGTLQALACFENLVAGAGGTITARSSAYRPQWYQDHLRAVATTAAKLQGWLEFECAETRLTALYECQHHDLTIGAPVAEHSAHTDGVAFDVRVYVPEGFALDATANSQCHLVRDELPIETWHWHYIGG